MGSPTWGIQEILFGLPATHPPEVPVDTAPQMKLPTLVHDPSSPILAWRGWRIGNGRLISVGIGTVAWPTRRIFHAVCHAGDTSYAWRDNEGAHNAPDIDCACGVYGFAAPSSLKQVRDQPVLGRVQLGGTVVVCASEGRPIADQAWCGSNCGPDCDEHPRVLGYRAQSAYPSLLYTWPKPRGSIDANQYAVASRGGLKECNDRIKALAQAYGVECAPIPDELMAALWPKPQPSAAKKPGTVIPAGTFGRPSAMAAHQAQTAILQQIYNQQQPTVHLNGDPSTWQQAYGQQQMAGGFGGLVAAVPADQTTMAHLLGISVATPSTVGLHDHLTSLAKLMGLVNE